MTQCEICEEMRCKDCLNCYIGNPCLGCDDYDRQNDICKSNGGCADTKEVNHERTEAKPIRE